MHADRAGAGHGTTSGDAVMVVPVSPQGHMTSNAGLLSDVTWPPAFFYLLSCSLSFLLFFFQLLHAVDPDIWDHAAG